MMENKRYYLKKYTREYCSEKGLALDSPESIKFQKRYSDEYDKQLKSAQWDVKWLGADMMCDDDVAYYANHATKQSLYLYTKQHWKDQCKLALKVSPLLFFICWLLWGGGLFFICVMAWMLWFSWDCCCNGGASK